MSSSKTTSQQRAMEKRAQQVSRAERSATAKSTLDKLKRVPRAPGKGKKEAKIKLVPESQRIFSGLVFYFFPNNDTNGARRMRITKALEYGAVWVVDWCDAITHVIMDKDIPFAHLTRHLKIDALPQDVVVVIENYPADCIMFRAMVNPKQPRYLASGCPPTGDGLANDDADVPSTQSIQVKHPITDGADARSATPSMSSESSGEEDRDPSLRHQQPPEPFEGSRASAMSAVYHDVLENIITEARDVDYLEMKPVDLDDDGYSSHVSDPTESETEDGRPIKVAKTRPGQHAGSAERFQCMKKNDGKTGASNPNSRTIEVLTEMGNYYEQTGDGWRSLAYRKAVSVLRRENHKVATREEAARLPSIGNRLAAKIEEIVWTDHLRRLENARLEPADEALNTFLGIYGVGLSTARKWISAGMHTLDDLGRHHHHVSLSPVQQIGLAHYADFSARIPRTEVARHAAVVRAGLEAIDPAFTATVAGSYRRGAPDSGVIDILISHPHADLTRLQHAVFDELVPSLTASGFLKAALASNRHGYGTKWLGASALAGSAADQNGGGAAAERALTEAPWRRIDLLLVPSSQLGAALIYFTGNDVFNRSIRLLASKRNMRLNQHGLYADVMRGPGRARLTNGRLVEGSDEKKIFDALGVPWRPPEHRIC